MLPDIDRSDDFYAELTKRNRGLIAEETQQRLRSARLVIAGCGSTGGAAIMPLVRTGATRFLLADPDVFELSNLNRQNATIDDVGRNKAQVAAATVRAVNPHAVLEVREEGIPTAGVADLLTSHDVVIDAIDVTTASGLAAKQALHEGAATIGVPVVTAYDIAGAQFIEIFDYRQGGRPLAGKTEGKHEPADVLAALIPPTALPEEILPIIVSGDAFQSGFPQLAMTANLFGALVVPIVLTLLDGGTVKRRIRLDLFGAIAPQPHRTVRRVRTLLKLPLAWFVAKSRSRS